MGAAVVDVRDVTGRWNPSQPKAKSRRQSESARAEQGCDRGGFRVGMSRGVPVLRVGPSRTGRDRVARDRPGPEGVPGGVKKRGYRCSESARAGQGETA